MNILVVNDDGIDAAGIHKLAEALADAGDVYVCSPHKQQSASGHGITIGRLVYIEDVPFAGAKAAIAMEGSPADCVKIGIEVYRDRGIEMDMVFSGFNHGMNLGTDTLYSGTVSAAVEGALCGLPAAALSISSNLSFHRTPEHFEAAMKLALRLARSEMFSKRPKDPRALGIGYINDEHTILNVNIPDLPAGAIKGIKVCPLSYRAYDEWFEERKDEAGRVGYHYSGAPLVIGEAEADESDIIANGLGYATITPLRFDLTNFDLIGAVRAEWAGVNIKD
ncbi:MAG: 5'/3'-nucleotidase SurE [Clostridiales Family XIII bacterium]|nr:5'/3'-nucleotidase SurE [Clostridiales Family XIII bacterium]